MSERGPDPLGPLRRATLRALADVVVPQRGAMPSGSAIGLEGEPVDRVLRARPDLVMPLAGLLDRLAGQEAASAVSDLPDRDPAGFSVLMQAVAGAYFMHERVRAALGYFGQEAITLDRGGFGGEDLLERAMDRPPRYRRCEGSEAGAEPGER